MKYLNPRQLLADVEDSIYRDSRWVVFAPNHAETWAEMRRQVESLLEGYWRRGALAGKTRDEAFRVRCDRDTMNEDDIVQGRLIMEVGLAPTRPGEFVVLRIERHCGA